MTLRRRWRSKPSRDRCASGCSPFMNSISCCASVCARTLKAYSRQAEQAKLNATLAQRREQYKDKNQHYLDLKAPLPAGRND